MANKNSDPLRRMVYAAMFGALTAIGSFMVIPLQPVPITLQTLFTGLAGVFLGPNTAALSQIIYVLLGMIGLPVFAGRYRFWHPLRPYGRISDRFRIGAYIIGKIVEIKPNPGVAWIVMALLAGNVMIYTCGTVQLSLVTQFSWPKALLVGVLPFIIGDLLKLSAAAWLALKMRQHFNN